MSGKSLKFDEFEVNKKDFHVSKQPIGIYSVDINRIATASKIEPADKSFKYFIGYADDDIIRSLRIKLPQMNGFIKYSE